MNPERNKSDAEQNRQNAGRTEQNARRTERNAVQRKLDERIAAVDSLVCIGLDPDVAQMPPGFREGPSPLATFCRGVADATAEFAAAFKLNTAFFEAYGAEGWRQLEELCRDLRTHHPAVMLIADAKRADIGNTNRGYATAFFDELGCDAVTLHPYLGQEALAPFLERQDKACIVLCRTSNAGARELQDLSCDGVPLFHRVAERVTQHWDRDGNCMLVVGATFPEDMRRLRTIAPHTTFLVPGIGEQGGAVDAVVRAGLNAEGRGLLLSCSRAVLYSEDPAAAARALRDAVRTAVAQTLASRQGSGYAAR